MDTYQRLDWLEIPDCTDPWRAGIGVCRGTRKETDQNLEEVEGRFLNNNLYPASHCLENGL